MKIPTVHDTVRKLTAMARLPVHDNDGARDALTDAILLFALYAEKAERYVADAKGSPSPAVASLSERGNGYRCRNLNATLLSTAYERGQTTVPYPGTAAAFITGESRITGSELQNLLLHARVILLDIADAACLRTE